MPTPYALQATRPHAAAAAPAPAPLADAGPAADLDDLDDRSAPTPADRLQALHSALAERVLRHARDGVMLRPPALPALALMRNDQPYANVCASYQPCVALILQGRKRVELGADSLVYGPGRYLISALDLPVRAALLEASPQRPYLGLGLALDWREMASLLPLVPPPSAAGAGQTDAVTEPDEALEPAGTAVSTAGAEAVDQRAISTGEVTLPLLQAFERLLALLDEPDDLPVLAPLVLREIHYRLLVGEAGARLRRMASVGSQSQHIARAVAHLNTHFAEPLRVQTLARLAHMSASTFHHHFKAMTAMSPLQYQKQLRLAEARRLMLTERLEVSSAAFRVGYESASQFSREYSRHFGSPPSRDAALRPGGHSNAANAVAPAGAAADSTASFIAAASITAA